MTRGRPQKHGEKTRAVSLRVPVSVYDTVADAQRDGETWTDAAVRILKRKRRTK